MATTPKKTPREKLAQALRVNDTITEPAPFVGAAFGPIGAAVGKAIDVVGDAGGRVADRLDPGGGTTPDVKGAGNAPASSSTALQGGTPIGGRKEIGAGLGFQSQVQITPGALVTTGPRLGTGAVPVQTAPAPAPKSGGVGGLGLLALGLLGLKLLL